MDLVLFFQKKMWTWNFRFLFCFDILFYIDVTAELIATQSDQEKNND